MRNWGDELLSKKKTLQAHSVVTISQKCLGTANSSGSERECFLVNIQYLGFEQDLKFRRYSFRVIETLKENREFQLSVANHAVVACKFKFQDIPDLCFSKLKRDLESEKFGELVALQCFVSEMELNQYISDHYPAKKKRI